MPLATGTHIGPYSVVGLLGAGGMGEVYRARDSRLNRDVAIKILPAAVAADPGRLARFQREAQVLASLSHPHIAAIYGVEESGGAIALVMELVEGSTLAERIAQGPIPREEALALARQIADGLEAAHEKGIVHRDLKPANIKITPEGTVKILDFGLAKAYDAESASGAAASAANSPTLTLDNTRAGLILGTAGYMSPEQARGKPVDKRADIWAFGVVLMEMLTGKLIFQGETVSDTMAAVLRADVDWHELPADTPSGVRRLLQRCLERDPKRRLRDIGDAWVEVDAPAEPAAPPTVAVAAKRAWLPWVAGAVLGAAGIAWGVLHQPVVPRSPVHWTFSSGAFYLLPSFSRDGSQIALTEARPNSLALVARRLDENELRPIPGSEGMFYPVFSPDGQWILAYAGTNPSDGVLKKIPRNGGAAVTLIPTPVTMGFTWGDDDSIVIAADKGLKRIASYGGNAQKLIDPDTAKGEKEFSAPHFLPGAGALLFTLGTITSNKIAVLDMKTHQYHALIESGQDGRYVSAGYVMFTRGDAVYAAPFDLRSQKVTGPELPVIEHVALSGINAVVADYAVSENGLLIYREGSSDSGMATALGWVDRKGVAQPVSESAMWGTGRLSPDGLHVANEIYTSSAGDREPGDIWVFEFERHTRTRLTYGGINSLPIWTPDGHSITFYSETGEKRGIFTVMADGSSKPQLLLATNGRAYPGSWTPDGKTLFYQLAVSGTPASIWAVNFAGGVAGQPVRLHDTTASEVDPQISPDGHWLAYISGETGQQEAYLQPYPGPGGKERVSTEGAQSVRWSRDGKELLYMRRTGQGSLNSVAIETKPRLHISAPVVLVQSSFGTTWDTAPDSKHFLVEIIRNGPQAGSMIRGVSDWFEELRRRVPSKR